MKKLLLVCFLALVWFYPAFSQFSQSKHLSTIGDSQTANCGWQPHVVETVCGLEWSEEETTKGIDGHRPLAVSGSWMMPKDSESICLRGRDAIYYHPDYIIIYAGQNDVLDTWKSEDNTGSTPLEIVDQEAAYHLDSVDETVSTISAFKGLIEYLIEKLPGTKICLMTHVPILGVVGMNPSAEFSKDYPSPRFATLEEVIHYEETERKPKDEYIRALGQYYGLDVIDLWNEAGITYYNVDKYYNDPEGDCTQVHLNAVGEAVIANAITMHLFGQRQAHSIYNLEGIRQRLDCGMESLPAGLYIIDRQKILKK